MQATPSFAPSQQIAPAITTGMLTPVYVCSTPSPRLAGDARMPRHALTAIAGAWHSHCVAAVLVAQLVQTFCMPVADDIQEQVLWSAEVAYMFTLPCSWCPTLRTHVTSPPLMLVRRLVPAQGTAPICYAPADPSQPGYDQMCIRCPAGTQSSGSCGAPGSGCSCRCGHTAPSKFFVCSSISPGSFCPVWPSLLRVPV